MPLEDLYEAEDERKRRWRLAIIIGILIFFSNCALVFFFLDINLDINQPNPKNDLAVLRVQRLERVINLCQNLPKPEFFYRENEIIPKHDDDLTIYSETYKSTRPSNEIMPFFQVWFASNDWIRRERKPGERWSTASAVVTTFFKGNQEISVASNDWTGFYTIECQEKEAAPLPE